jgi:dipeptidase D
MDMISMGPNIRTPHSPQEKMEVASIEKLIAFLLELLASF